MELFLDKMTWITLNAPNFIKNICAHSSPVGGDNGSDSVLASRKRIIYPTDCIHVPQLNMIR